MPDHRPVATWMSVPNNGFPAPGGETLRPHVAARRPTGATVADCDASHLSPQTDRDASPCSSSAPAPMLPARLACCAFPSATTAAQPLPATLHHPMALGPSRRMTPPTPWSSPLRRPPGRFKPPAQIVAQPVHQGLPLSPCVRLCLGWTGVLARSRPPAASGNVALHVSFFFSTTPSGPLPCPALPCPAGLLVPTYSLSKEGGAGGHVVQSPTTPDQNESGRRRGVANGRHRLGAAAAAPFGEKRGAARSRTKRPACHGVNADNPVRAVSRAGGVD
ncbi:hypothetical protein Purlil1_1124 [Purpureocillium lilacinum]|uniref:Uncharacterized protein n=1 Tax=Purpureocillium lilacinum TaxID=33203 RepID=A0ABR0CDZ0_PURLI|nr:hypothetical protein Purlil1_1124 [Purpureocillium lilacinum]